MFRSKLRPGPTENVAGVMVQRVATPDNVQVRRVPISRLIMDTSIPAAPRDYVKERMVVTSRPAAK